MFVRFATANLIQKEKYSSQIAVATPFAILPMISSDVPTLNTATGTITDHACVVIIAWRRPVTEAKTGGNAPTAFRQEKTETKFR